MSRASALQRKGRAGRVRAGVCWGMYTRDRFEQRMRRYQVASLPAIRSHPFLLTSTHLLCCHIWHMYEEMWQPTVLPLAPIASHR